MSTTPLCDDLPPAASFGVRRSSSSITKWTARMSRELIDLESPNFTRTCKLTYSTATLYTGYEVINNFRFGSHREKIVENAADFFLAKILHTYQKQSPSQSCLIRSYELLPVGFKMQLNCAQKCVKRSMSRIIQPRMNHPILNGHLYRPILRRRRIWCHQVLPIGSCRTSNKTTENTASDG